MGPARILCVLISRIDQVEICMRIACIVAIRPCINTEIAAPLHLILEPTIKVVVINFKKITRSRHKVDIQLFHHPAIPAPPFA